MHMKTHTQVIRPLAYRWFLFGIFLGGALALLLLVNSIANYYSVSRRIAIEHTRQELGRKVVTLDRDVQQNNRMQPGELEPALDQFRQANPEIAWIRLLGRDNQVAAQTGNPQLDSFSMEYIREQMRNRRPAFRITDTSGGRLIVEWLPFRLPGKAPRQFGIIEVAMRVEMGEVPWTLRRNLIINVSAALALLASLTALGLRFRSYWRAKQLEDQLKIARHVQEDLFPSRNEAPEGFQMAAECTSASLLGGDFYDVFAVNGAGTAFVLGDVSGKGIPAALLMGVIHGAVRASDWTGSAQEHEQATGRINKLLCQHAAKERYASMFWSYFDPRTQMLHYINAGHFPPLLFRAADAAHSEPLRLSEGGPVLGLLPNARYRQGAVRLEPGDLLVCYSDGVIEAGDAEGEPFGEQRLVSAVQDCLHCDAKGIRDKILARLEAHAGGYALEDDRTLLVLRYKGRAARIHPQGADLEYAGQAA